MPKILVADDSSAESEVEEPIPLTAPLARAAGDAAGIEDAKSALNRLAGVPGVALAVLVDREGFLIEAAGDRAAEAEAAGALAGCLAEASEAIGRELSQGSLTGLVAEYDAGLVLVNRIGSGAMLATVLRDPALLDRVRHQVKKTLSDLIEVA